MIERWTLSLPLALLFVGSGYAQNADFGGEVDVKAISTRLKETAAAQCPKSGVCSATLYGTPEVLTEKLRIMQKFYNISVGCPESNGSLDITGSPIRPAEEGGKRDSVIYEIVSEDYVRDRVDQLGLKGFRVTETCEGRSYPPAPAVLTIEAPVKK